MNEHQQEVRRAYADLQPDLPDSDRDLRFHTEVMSIAAAKAAIRSVKTYNRFTEENVRQKLDAIARVEPDARVVFGRESSPVLYVETDDPDFVMDVFRPYPDELGTRKATKSGQEPEEGRVWVRAWWD